MRTVYLIGYPGVGKTTAMRHALSCLVARPLIRGQLPLTTYRWPRERDTVAVQLGRERARFGGTDTLHMGIQPHALAWMRSATVPLVVGEGDRLANDGFLEVAAEQGELVVVLIELGAAEALERARARAWRYGTKPQTGSWVAGRRTKTDRLAERWGALRLDGRRAPGCLGAELREVMGL